MDIRYIGHIPPAKLRGGTLMLPLLFVMLCAGVAAALETTAITVGGVRLVAEVADDPFERSAGLMYRESLPEDRGMLFVYPDEAPRSFWMKNTHIPLSVAFVDAGGVIIAIMDMIPDDDTMRYRSPRPAMYALEVNRGWFDKHGVRVGDRLDLTGR